MSIEKKCENCANYHKIDDEDYCNCMCGSHYELPCVENNLMFFRPGEKAIREDERNLIIEELEKIKKIVDDNKKSYIISANLLMIIEMIKEHKYDSR